MSKTILCADDSATMQTVAAITFKATDYQCVGARSADEALKLARASKPDVILADAIMPGKTGYDLCREVKSDPALSDVPVLLLCGNSQPYDEGKGKSAGADGHLTKPWDTQQLLDRLSEILGKVGESGVARPAASSAAAAAPPARPATPPPRAPTPPPVAPVTRPSPVQQLANPSPAPQPPRSATLMGMPTLKMPPGKDKPEGVTPITPPSQAAKAETPARPSVPSIPPVTPPVKPVRPVTPAPIPSTQAAKPPPSAPAPLASVKPLAPPVVAPVATRPASPPTSAAGAAAASGRKPMIGGTPSKPPSLAAARALARAQEAAAAVAREHGLDLSGPEMAALLKISQAVVERIVWEVVPDLAESIIRENLDKLTARES